MKIDKTKGRILYPVLFVILSLILAYNIFQLTSPSDSLKVKAYKVSDGWGFQILQKDEVFIDQPFIPVFSGKKPFPDKRSALKAGNIVKERIVNHLQPALKKEDLEKIGLDSSGNLN